MHQTADIDKGKDPRLLFMRADNAGLNSILTGPRMH